MNKKKKNRGCLCTKFLSNFAYSNNFFFFLLSSPLSALSNVCVCVLWSKLNMKIKRNNFSLLSRIICIYLCTPSNLAFTMLLLFFLFPGEHITNICAPHYLVSTKHQVLFVNSIKDSLAFSLCMLDVVISIIDLLCRNFRDFYSGYM